MVMKSLETINLGHNNITNEGIHRLKDGLLQNKSLLRIGLQSAKLSCEGSDILVHDTITVEVRNKLCTGCLKAKVTVHRSLNQPNVPSTDA